MLFNSYLLCLLISGHSMAIAYTVAPQGMTWPPLLCWTWLVDCAGCLGNSSSFQACLRVGTMHSPSNPASTISVTTSETLQKAHHISSVKPMASFLSPTQVQCSCLLQYRKWKESGIKWNSLHVIQISNLSAWCTVMLENYTWYLFMLFMLIAMRSHNFVSHIKYVDIKNNIK